MIKAIVITTNRLRPNLIRVKGAPKEDISKKSRGIRILALAQRKISKFRP
jgi:hypothetical protein